MALCKNGSSQQLLCRHACGHSLLLFITCPAISIDNALIECSRCAVIVQARFVWSDVGSWESLWRASVKSPEGNVVTGDVLLIGTSISLIYAGCRMVSVVGMDDVVVIETGDAVLVIHKNKTQGMKALIAQLQAANRPELQESERVRRSWSWYEVSDKDSVKVTRLMIAPGKSLSTQMHRLHNPGTNPLHIIEVQSCVYTEKDDIARFRA